MATQWTARDVSGPPDLSAMRNELRRAYVEFLRANRIAQQIRREIDAQTSDPGRRLVRRQDTALYLEALDDAAVAARDVATFASMINTEIILETTARDVVSAWNNAVMPGASRPGGAR